jgi:hypothetical protein
MDIMPPPAPASAWATLSLWGTAGLDCDMIAEILGREMLRYYTTCFRDDTGAWKNVCRSFNILLSIIKCRGPMKSAYSLLATSLGTCLRLRGHSSSTLDSLRSSLSLDFSIALASETCKLSCEVMQEPLEDAHPNVNGTVMYCTSPMQQAQPKPPYPIQPPRS